MNIIFDMGGTLVRNIDASFIKGFRHLFSYVVGYQKIEIETYLNDVINITTNLYKAREETMLEVSFEQVIEAINEKYLFSITNELAQEIFVSTFEEIQLFDGIIPFLELLKAHNIPCFILSNSTFLSKYLMMQLEKVGILKYFKACISSADVGYRKPHPLFFLYLLNKYNLDKNDTYMIGNDFGKDIIPALDLGLNACFFSDTKPFNTHPNLYYFTNYYALKTHFEDILK